MRFHSDGPSIPDLLLERCEAGEVVFLCGAGVSINSGMPNFDQLVEFVIGNLKLSPTSEIRHAFDSYANGTRPTHITLDQIFQMLYKEYRREEVDALVTERLAILKNRKNVGREHGWIKRISRNKCGKSQIVTTNFDLLFEHGEEAGSIPVHVPPTFPDPSFELPIEGIIYLHGRLATADTCGHGYILSRADFGTAYLSKAWATKFINGLLERYTVVLVGYQANDPPMEYLLQGINRDGQSDNRSLFAFEKGEPNQNETKWRDRGVTPIVYQDHDLLWQTMESWAERVDDPRTWRRNVVKKAERNPSELLPYERGQVAHVLRFVPGAQLFAEMEPTPHPEWICVLDASIRSSYMSGPSWDDPTVAKSEVAYDLDEDGCAGNDESNQRDIRHDHLLAWRDGDDNPPGFHRIGSYQVENHKVIPSRLKQLNRWIASHYHSPVIAWWVARQREVHFLLIDKIESHLRHDDGVEDRCRKVWNLILEHHRDSRNRTRDAVWYNFRRRLKNEGWTSGILREFRGSCQPLLDITTQVGQYWKTPPTSNWNDIQIRDVAQFKVRYLERYRREDLNITDEVLPVVFGIMEDHLSMAAGLLSDIETYYFHTPTCYPNREHDDEEHRDDFSKPFLLFVELFERLMALNSQLAKAHAMRWDEGEGYFYRKLKLYALSMPNLFKANDAVGFVVSMDQDAFWDMKVVRELLYLLVDRWSCISEKNKEALTERILAGPSMKAHWSDQEYFQIRDNYAASYARYLQLNGCEFSSVTSRKLNKLISGIPDWSDGRAKSLVIKSGIRVGFVGTDDSPEVLQGLKLSEIVSRAEADLPRDFGSMTKKRPFDGLVKVEPRKALLALILESRRERFPEFAWSAMIEGFPKDASFKLVWAFHKGLTRMPNNFIVTLRHSIGQWLVENLKVVVELDADLGWKMYDYFVDGILSGAEEAVASPADRSYPGDDVSRQPPRTYTRAINGPLGKCAEALLTTVPGETQEAGSLIPSYIKVRFECLLKVRGEGGDHTLSILMSRLNWVMHVDPQWAKKHLTPKLVIDHNDSEPAWNGLFHSRYYPSINVALVIKPLLSKLYPWIGHFDWYNDVSEIAVGWMAWMCVFRRGEIDGLDSHEMRAILRKMDQHSRKHVIFWLGRVGQSNDRGWLDLVIPFINEVWPREEKFRNNESASQWVRLLEYTKDDFPTVYASVKRFLVPVEIDSILFYRFTRDAEGEELITVQHPEEVLDLMSTLAPVETSRLSDALPKILTIIRETDPKLSADPRYTRLIDLIDRT